MKAIIPIVKSLTKAKIVLELQIRKLFKIYGTQIPQKLPSFSAHKQQVYIPLCTHVLNHFSYSHHAGSTVIEGAPYLCFEFGPVLVWY